MTSGKSLKSLIKSLYIVALAAPFLLSACGGSIEPGPMPTGYKYHNGAYKAPPGAEPAFWEKGQSDQDGSSTQTRELAPLGSDRGRRSSGDYENNATMSAEMMAWLPASRELVGRIKTRLGYPVEPTYFEGMNGQSIPGFETALKTATTEQSWHTAPAQGQGPFHLAYSAQPSTSGDPSQLLLTVRLTVSVNNFVIEESGVYSIGSGSPAVMTAPADSTFPVTVE